MIEDDEPVSEDLSLEKEDVGTDLTIGEEDDLEEVTPGPEDNPASVKGGWLPIWPFSKKKK